MDKLMYESNPYSHTYIILRLVFVSSILSKALHIYKHIFNFYSLPSKTACRFKISLPDAMAIAFRQPPITWYMCRVPPPLTPSGGVPGGGIIDLGVWMFQCSRAPSPNCSYVLTCLILFYLRLTHTHPTAVVDVGNPHRFREGLRGIVEIWYFLWVQFRDCAVVVSSLTNMGQLRFFVNNLLNHICVIQFNCWFRVTVGSKKLNTQNTFFIKQFLVFQNIG